MLSPTGPEKASDQRLQAVPREESNLRSRFRKPREHGHDVRPRTFPLVDALE
jgi:hypothetical protein